MSVPALAMLRVSGADPYGEAGASRGGLSGLELVLEPGLHAVLGNPLDGTLALGALAVGRSRPTAGTVRVAGRDPVQSPRVRARIGALEPDPALPASRTVLRMVGQVSAARAVPGDVLGAWGLARLGPRAPLSLSRAELRAVELALALATPEPILLWLHEPFDEVALDEAAVRAELRALAEAGACVLVTTSAPRQAAALADHAHVLRAGRVLGSDAQVGWPHAATAELLAWVDAEAKGGARALAQALSVRSELRRVVWEHEEGAPLAAVVHRPYSVG